MTILAKAIALSDSDSPLKICSAFTRDTLIGMIFIEARFSQDVRKTIEGIVGINPSQDLKLIPIEEMADLLNLRKQQALITKGSWLRFKKGLYKGDLARVQDIENDTVIVQFIPRLDLSDARAAEEKSFAEGPMTDENGAKRSQRRLPYLAGMPRPNAKFFHLADVRKVYGQDAAQKVPGGRYSFRNDEYENGFCVGKRYKLSSFVTENVQPNLDELQAFQVEDEDDQLTTIAKANQSAVASVLRPGDHIEILEGEQVGARGIVEAVSGDVVSMSVDNEQQFDVPASFVKKVFKTGDHIKVVRGKNIDETGLIVRIDRRNVTFVSDVSQSEVSIRGPHTSRSLKLLSTGDSFFE